MTVQHAKFLERLRASSPAVFAVAKHQHAKGRMVEIPPLRFAPTADQAEKFSDEGDLFVVTRHRVEVKHLGVNFTGAHDWPFKEVFVSSVSSVERANGAVGLYVSVSADLRFACCVVPTKTRPYWYVVEKKNSNTGNVEQFYACPLDRVYFEELT